MPIQAHRGQRAIAAAVSAVAQTLRTEHAIVGEVYECSEASVDGPNPATARGRIACVAHHWNERDGELIDAAWHLRYDDDYESTAAGWRIGRRALTINAIETRPFRRIRPRDLH